MIDLKLLPKNVAVLTAPRGGCKTTYLKMIRKANAGDSLHVCAGNCTQAHIHQWCEQHKGFSLHEMQSIVQFDEVTETDFLFIRALAHGYPHINFIIAISTDMVQA